MSKPAQALFSVPAHPHKAKTPLEHEQVEAFVQGSEPSPPRIPLTGPPLPTPDPRILTQRLSVDVPCAMMRRLKLLAVGRELTIREVVLAMLEHELERFDP